MSPTVHFPGVRLMQSVDRAWKSPLIPRDLCCPGGIINFMPVVRWTLRVSLNWGDRHPQKLDPDPAHKFSTRKLTCASWTSRGRKLTPTGEGADGGLGEMGAPQAGGGQEQRDKGLGPEEAKVERGMQSLCLGGWIRLSRDVPWRLGVRMILPHPLC